MISVTAFSPEVGVRRTVAPRLIGHREMSLPSRAGASPGYTAALSVPEAAGGWGSFSLSNLDERCAQTKSKSESGSMIWLTLPAPDLMAHEGACRSAHLAWEGALRPLLEKAAVAADLLDRPCLTRTGRAPNLAMLRSGVLRARAQQ
jgi:hypothetical protein